MNKTTWHVGLGGVLLMMHALGCSPPANDDADMTSPPREDMSATSDMGNVPADMEDAVEDMSSVEVDADADADQGSEDMATAEDLGTPDMDVDMPLDMAAPMPTEPTRLRLATWNIHYLDTPEEAERAPREQADYDRLKFYADMLAADVIALQEIHGVEGAHTVFSAVDWEVACEDRNSRQNVCLAIKKASGWHATRHPDVESLQANNPNLRRGLDITLEKPGYQPLRVLAVHMKADCYFGDTSGGCATFFQQLDALEAWVDARAEEDTPYVVVGDFNRFMTDDDQAWLELDDGMPARADLTRSIASGSTPCWGGMFSEFIDHIILEPESVPWLVDSAQLVFEETDFEANYEKLSDHCPLWADLDVPPATP